MAKSKSAKRSKSTGSADHLYTISAEMPMFDHRDKRTKEPKHLQMLDGFFDPDPMVQYIEDPKLDSSALTGGILRCKLDNKRLSLITDFGSAEKLIKPQLDALKEQCLGQWSDGLGEGAFDEFSETSGFEVDTMPHPVKVAQGTGKPFTPDAKAKATLKALKTKWKKVAKENAPKHEVKMLIKCFDAVNARKNGELKKLLESGKVDVNVACKAKTSNYDQDTLLVYAARHANATIVGTLLRAGADPNLQDQFSYGYAPLHRARHPLTVKTLLDAGAEANIFTRSFKETPLMQHEVVRHPESVELLLAAKAKPNAKPEFGKTPPLNVAVQVSPKSTKLLLKAGAKVTPDTIENAISPDNYAGTTNDKDRAEIVKLLLKAGAKPNVEHLIDAVGGELQEVVKVLLHANVPINKQGKFCSLSDTKPSPLTRAISWRRPNMVKFVLDQGADPNFGKGTDSPLHVAISEDSLPTVKLLIAAGAELEPVVKGETLEQTARRLGSKQIAVYFAKLEGGSARGKKTAQPTKAARKKAPAKKKTAKKSVTTQSPTTKKKSSAAKTKSGSSDKTKRMFEFVEGTSSKFWEIVVSGKSLTVRYGRIGSDGKTNVKTFENTRACQEAADKLISQKQKKGYEEKRLL